MYFLTEERRSDDNEAALFAEERREGLVVGGHLGAHVRDAEAEQDPLLKECDQEPGENLTQLLLLQTSVRKRKKNCIGLYYC